MFYNNEIWIGDADGKRVSILPKMANRHGLIAGATGTGKTVSLKVLAESFSDAGVPVFLADVKGDLAGMCKAGVDSEDMQKRIQYFGLADTGFNYHAYPTTFWDIYGQGGIPLRTTVSEMGPIMLAKLMDLNDTQTDVLNVVFKIADDQGQLLIDTKDLKAMLSFVAENNKEFEFDYGKIAPQSVSAIIRNIVSLEAQGADAFFTEPALDIKDWFGTDLSGHGMIHVLDSRQLVNNGTLYSAFLLWMLSELFEVLPEVGDMEKPRMVFFFDEAHLLFKDVSKALQDKIEQVVKLIRSKGVGVYFITQNPRDIPDAVLSQLGNKIQHALRAYTPADEKSVKVAADSFRPNPAFDTKETIMNLGTGEALVSVLDEKGIPTMVEKCRILPPQSLMGGIEEAERGQEFKKSNLYIKYFEANDPDSAYEFFERKKKMDEEEKIKAEEEKLAAKEAEKKAKEDAKAAAAAEKAAAKEAEKKKKAIKSGVSSVAKTVSGTVGRQVGNTLGQSIGGKFGKTLGGNLGAALGRNILGTLFK